MKILRAFQVINQDGQFMLSSTYNVVNNEGDTISQNGKDSFYVMNAAVKEHIQAIEDYITQVRLTDEGDV